MKEYLDEALIEYSRSDIYPFHMPGHKRQRLGNFTPEEIDITEIEGFDDLHRAEGIIREGQERLARVFGADESFWMVDGSTAGILASICGCMKRGGRLLIGRNCHLSVYHAAYLAEANLSYICPEPTEYGIQGSIAPESVEEALVKFPDTQAVVITSPTYDGVISDIRSIADIVHARRIPLIVDEAHGAHFGFSGMFPPKAIALGADLCVESLHKTLPAYTQSSVLHMMRTGGEPGDTYRFDPERVRRYLSIFQSSSPSYILMAGIDRCVRMIENGSDCRQEPVTGEDKRQSDVSQFGQFEERLRRFYEQCASLKAVQIVPGTDLAAGADADSFDGPDAGSDSGADAGFALRADTSPSTGIYARDPSKILISAAGAGLTGPDLYDLLLDKYHLQMEMAAGSYVTALTTIMDTDEGFERLLDALKDIDRTADMQTDDKPAAVDIPDTNLSAGGKPNTGDISLLYKPVPRRLEILQAMDAEAEEIPLTQAAGRIAAEIVCLYPPGIPVLVPGEEICEDLVRLLELSRDAGMNIRGIRDTDGLRIRVVV